MLDVGKKGVLKYACCRQIINSHQKVSYFYYYYQEIPTLNVEYFIALLNEFKILSIIGLIAKILHIANIQNFKKI